MAQVRQVEEGLEIPIREEHWRSIFNKYDRNRDGKLELSELRDIINSREYEHDIPEKAVQRILFMSDTDGNGFLDFNEFVKMIHNPVLDSIFGHFVNRYINSLIPRRKRVGTTSDEADGRYEEEYSFWPPPVWMILISLVEIVLYCIDASYGSTVNADGPVATGAIYDPRKRQEVWRYITYMFVHIGVIHLVVNLTVQLLLGVPLEMVHKGWRVLIIYFCGVLAGSLGTSITDPYVKLAGASGGVYSLITAHIATVIMNWKEMQLPLLQLMVFLLITVVDFGTAIYNRYWLDINDHVGYAAHLAGAAAGLLVGIFILKNFEINSFEKKLWWVSLITFIALMSTAVIWNIADPDHFPK